MKYLKTILVLLIFGSAFVACEKNEVSYAFQEISAPTNVTANFDIAQDDTGLVTVTPSGEGAESFQVYWGESANEDPEIVTPGGSLDHIYPEGEFQVRIVGVGSTNLTSEYGQLLTISFSAPEDLEVTIDQSSPDPKLIKVSASAVNASSFDVYFGDVDDEEPTQLMPNETIEYTYEAAGDYTVRVVAKGAGEATIEYSEEITITDAAGAIELPITFDDPAINYVGNIDGAFSVVDNPAPGGANDVDSKVGAIENAGDAFEAIVVNLGTPVDFSANKTITMKLWSTSSIPIAMKFEGGVDGERENEVVVTHGGTGWEDLTFNYATDAVKSYIDGNQGVGEPFVPTGKYATMVIFVDFAGTTAGTFYVDDIEQEIVNTTPLELPISFDDSSINYEAVIDGAFSVVDNPAPGGANNVASKVGAIENAGDAFEAIVLNMGVPVDFSTDKTITMKLWSTSSIPIAMKFEGGVNGERENEVVVTHGGTGWEDLTFNYATDATKSYIDGSQGVGEPFVPTGQYGTMVIFVDFAGTTAGTFYIDDIEQESAPLSPLEIPITFDDSSIDYEAVIDGGFSLVNNPAPGGANNVASKVGAIENAGDLYEAIVLNMGTPVDFGTDKIITLKLWSTSSLPVAVKFEGGVNAERENEVVVTHGGTGWEDLSFNFGTDATKSYIDGSQGVGEPFVPTGQYSTMVVFVDFGGPTAGTFYIDDIEQEMDDSGVNPPAAGPTSFPIDFETPETGASSKFDVFEADTPALEVIANPDMTGANNSATVAKFTAPFGGADYAGTVTKLNQTFTLDASNSTVSIMVWKPVISDVGIKFESAGASTGEIKIKNTKINEWEEIVFDFTGKIGEPSSTNIDAIVIFPDFDARTQDNVIYFDNITLSASSGGSGGTGGGGSGGTALLELPISFDDSGVTYDFGTFNGASYTVVDNPDASGANATVSKVGAITNSGGQWEGGAFNLDTPVDFSGTNKTITMKVWSDVAVPLLLKFEGGVSGERQTEVVASHGGTGWESISFNFTTDAVKSYIDGSQGVGEAFVPDGQYATIVFFVDGPGTTAGTFYVDDIIQE